MPCILTSYCSKGSIEVRSFLNESLCTYDKMPCILTSYCSKESIEVRSFLNESLCTYDRMPCILTSYCSKGSIEIRSFLHAYIKLVTVNTNIEVIMHFDNLFVYRYNLFYLDLPNRHCIDHITICRHCSLLILIYLFSHFSNRCEIRKS